MSWYQADNAHTIITLEGSTVRQAVYRVWRIRERDLERSAYVVGMFFTAQQAAAYAEWANSRGNHWEVSEPLPVLKPRRILQPLYPGPMKDEGQGIYPVHGLTGRANNPDGKPGGRQDRCSVCGELGHKKPTCGLINNGRAGKSHAPRNTKGRRCSRCDYVGHNIQTCGAIFHRDGTLLPSAARGNNDANTGGA